MDIHINGHEYHIKFSYRTITALLKKMKAATITEVAQLASKVDLTQIHELIYEAIVINLTTADGPVDAPKPTKDQILWAIDESPALSGEFLEGFMNSLTQLMPTADETAAEVETGN